MLLFCPFLVLADDINHKNKTGSKSTRKCSYCREICKHPVKLCSGCKKRAYCSENCQKLDRSISGTGQRHVNWCTLYECGEEDVDWEIVPVPNKGLGVIAKRLLPAGYRIMADPVYTNPHNHPRLMELAPEGAPLDVKFRINAMAGHPERDGGANIVGLRIARVNHDCRPNAGYIYDETAHVQILFAQRDIHPGEEICISYCSFANLNMERETSSAKIRAQNPESEFESVQQVLQSTWGITCPDDCYCKDPLARQLVLDGRKMKEELDDLAGRGWTDQALKAGAKLLEIQRRLDVSWICRVSTELYLFQVAIGRRKTLPEAEKHIRAVYDVYKLICPHSKSTTMKYEKLLSHPEWDGNYLVMECNRDRC